MRIYLAGAVRGQACAGCDAAVKRAARSIDGVKAIKASYANKNAEVTYDPSKTSPHREDRHDKSAFEAEPSPSRQNGTRCGIAEARSQPSLDSSRLLNLEYFVRIAPEA
jgi:copper chaperone CopZ